MLTDKKSCRIIAGVLAQHGVKDAVISPGSRNTPLILAFDNQHEICKHVVVDERSAAFMALGMAQVSRNPVALVCTSGTALLNYAPAVAEAYYQGIPLIVISADRPEQWIDQDDSQTMRQFEALGNFVKRSYDLPDTPMKANEDEWFANRIANNACLTAMRQKPGPVHINVQLDAPLSRAAMGGISAMEKRAIGIIEPEYRISKDDVARLAEKAAGRRILVVAGFMPPDSRLNRELLRFISLPNVRLMQETIANLHLPGRLWNVDSILSVLSDEEKERLRPDIVISIGGALVSRLIKEYLRSYPPGEHWIVGVNPETVDCFKSLTCKICCQPSRFFRQFGGAMSKQSDNPPYAALWEEAEAKAICSQNRYLANIPWSDMSALRTVFRKLPASCNLQLSNGTSVRYAQILMEHIPHGCYCNRGVSGIDGSTSTAVGAAIAYPADTVLITGDLSFSYDISALASHLMPPRMKIILMNNSGGGIFRFIGSTRSLDCLEKYFCANPALDYEKIVKAFGYDYLRATNEAELMKMLPRLLSDSEKSTVLEIVTPPETSAEVLLGYMSRLS